MKKSDRMGETEQLRLFTKHLDLMAATLDQVQAELASIEQLAVLLGARVEPGWPPGEYDRGAQEFFRDRLVEGGPSVVGWYGWYAVLRGSGDQGPVLVGAGGYLGPPGEDGVVEIGFSVMPDWQGRGYATEMAEALVRKALADPGVHLVVAHTAPGNRASSRVLEKAGFCCVGEDGETGTVRFEIKAGKSVLTGQV